MSTITESNKIVVPYKDLERQISDLNENKAYVIRAEPVNQLDEKSNWNIYWRTSSFIEPLRTEAQESEKLQEKSIITISESNENLVEKSFSSIKNTNKISSLIKQFFKRVHL